MKASNHLVNMRNEIFIIGMKRKKQNQFAIGILFGDVCSNLQNYEDDLSAGLVYKEAETQDENVHFLGHMPRVKYLF